MKKLCCSLIAAAVMSTALPCFAMTVYDPTNYAANLETKIQMIQQVNQSAQQLQAQIKDIQSLNPQDMDKAYNQECLASIILSIVFALSLRPSVKTGQPVLKNGVT